jgi:tetratricopeptide (TPR) repeat protein
MGTRFRETRRQHLQGLWRDLLRCQSKEDVAAAVSAIAGERLGARVIEKALQAQGPPISVRTHQALDVALEQVADRCLPLKTQPVRPQLQTTLMCPTDPHGAHAAALVNYQHAQFRAAIGWADRCVALCQARPGVHFDGCQASALRIKASAHSFLYELDSAQACIAQSVAISERCGDQVDQAAAQAAWGWIALQAGTPTSLREAQQRYHTAVKLSAACMASYHHGLGHILLRRQEPLAALRHFQDGMGAYADNPLGRANCLYGQGRALQDRCELDGAMGLFQTAEDLYGDVRNDLGQALSKQGRLQVLVAQRPSSLAGARSLCAEAQELFLRSGDLRRAQQCRTWQERHR